MRLIPDQVSPATKSQAERQLFRRLRRLEGTDWYWALHSLNLSEATWKRMAEADFIIAGPRGVYVIEVKGGLVACRNGIWEFTDRYGNTRRKRESPFNQARTAMFALEKLIERTAPTLNLSRITFGHAVALPDCELNVSSVEWAPEMVLDKFQLDRPDGIRRSLGRLAHYWRAKPGGRDGTLTEHDAALLLQALRPDFDTVPTLRQLASAADEELVSLTDGQYRMLDAYARNPRILFEGGAGTGKTMLAVEICRRLVAQGRAVLFTCRSEVLAGFVAVQPGLDGVDVIPFDRLHNRSTSRYDALVADEAQDLVNLDDLSVLDTVLTGGLHNGTWLLFMDSNNQRGLVGSFDPAAMDLLHDIRPVQLALTDNCRNTKEIVTRTQEFTGADVGVSTAGSGPHVSLNRVRAMEQGAALAAAYLDQLEQQNIDASDAVLLSAEPLSTSVFAALPVRWRHRVEVLDLGRMRRPARGRVGFARIREFKGLESRFILLDHLCGRRPDVDRSNLYVGMTRARVGLWVVTDESFSGSADGVGASSGD